MEKVKVKLKRNIIAIVQIQMHGGAQPRDVRTSVPAGSVYEMTPGELPEDYYVLLEDVHNEEIRKASENLEKAQKEAEFFNSRREALHQEKLKQLQGLQVQQAEKEKEIEATLEVRKKKVKG